MENDINTSNYKTAKEINLLHADCISKGTNATAISLVLGSIAIPFMFKNIHIPIGNEYKLGVTGVSFVILSILIGFQTKRQCEQNLIKKILEEEIA